MTEYQKPELGKLDDGDLEKVSGGAEVACFSGSDVSVACAQGTVNKGYGGCGTGSDAGGICNQGTHPGYRH